MEKKKRKLSEPEHDFFPQIDIDQYLEGLKDKPHANTPTRQSRNSCRQLKTYSNEDLKTLNDKRFSFTDIKDFSSEEKSEAKAHELQLGSKFKPKPRKRGVSIDTVTSSSSSEAGGNSPS